MRTLRRLTLAAALSGLAHVAAIGLAQFSVPSPPVPLPPLAVRIASVAPPPSLPSVSAPPVKKTHRASAVPRRAPLLAMNQTGSSVIGSADPEYDVAPTDTAAIADEPATTVSTEPVIVATAPTLAPAPEAPPVRALPRKGRITYNLVYGRDQFPVGRTIQTWEMDGTSYRLASRSETTGLVDLIRSQHGTYLSRGSLTRRGLRPDTFLMSRNRGRGGEEARALFDWSGATLSLEGSAAPHNEKLPAGTQDILSLMYQLSLDPPAMGRFSQNVTNGRSIEIYELDALPEETIETPLGALRALPVKQVRKPGEESLELWFATEYRYLPVRIRFFNRDGEPRGEQIVTEIRLAEE